MTAPEACILFLAMEFLSILTLMLISYAWI
jgi:hypothetical protein